MATTFGLLTLAGLFALIPAACKKSESTSNPDPRAEVRCTTRIGSDELDACSATTRLRPRVGAPLRLEERVWFDEKGGLMRAETWARDEAGTPEVRVTFDRRTGVVVLERGYSHASGEGRVFEGAMHRAEWSVPTTEPWAYAPIIGPTGESFPTPLASWVSYRAGRIGLAVRVIHPHTQQSFVVPKDQLVVDGAVGQKGGTVVLGDDGADIDDRFVDTVRVGAAGVALIRVGGTSLSSFSFAVQACDATASCGREKSPTPRGG